MYTYEVISEAALHTMYICYVPSNAVRKPTADQYTSIRMLVYHAAKTTLVLGCGYNTALSVALCLLAHADGFDFHFHFRVLFSKCQHTALLGKSDIVSTKRQINHTSLVPKHEQKLYTSQGLTNPSNITERNANAHSAYYFPCT